MCTTELYFRSIPVMEKMQIVWKQSEGYFRYCSFWWQHWSVWPVWHVWWKSKERWSVRWRLWVTANLPLHPSIWDMRLPPTLGGSILGVLIGEKIIPYIIIYAYGIIYPYMNNILVPYNMFTVFLQRQQRFSVHWQLPVLPVIKPWLHSRQSWWDHRLPKNGKRVFMEKITFIWRHLSFTWKSTIRNLFRYKKRFFMTVFGIGGCMALMLCGFGLKILFSRLQISSIKRFRFMVAGVSSGGFNGWRQRRTVWFHRQRGGNRRSSQCKYA